MHREMRVEVVGMVWYEANDYEAIRRVMQDGHVLPATFHEWRMNAEQGEKRLRRAGQTVIRVLVDSRTFPDWCRANGLNVDSKARNLFAGRIAAEKYAGAHRADDGLH